MDKEIDLSKYEIHTDLAIDSIEENKEILGVKYKNEKINDLIVTTVTLEKENGLRKKPGRYITIEFDDATDSKNRENIINTLIKVLGQIINIKKDSLGIVIGLGNYKSTPDSLGPLVVNNIIVTNHIYMLGELSSNYKRLSTLVPGVMATTGLETSDIIESVVSKVKPDYVIAIDSLASKSIERLNKTIQITDTGIQPGGGIGNKRKEISSDTLKIPVIAIGVPTVVDASVIVSDTINYIYKNYEFNKEHANKPSSKLTFNNVNYLKSEIKENKADKEKLLGMVGTLNSEELNRLIFEVLSPIGYNLMVTPKEIDFVIKELSDVISISINKLIHDIDKIH